MMRFVLVLLWCVTLASTAPVDDDSMFKCGNVLTQLLLYPCYCDPSTPDELQCTGAQVNDISLRWMSHHWSSLKQQRSNLAAQKLSHWVEHFSGLQVKNTALTELHESFFADFALTTLRLDSNPFLRHVSLGRIIKLKNFYIANMPNVSINE